MSDVINFYEERVKQFVSTLKSEDPEMKKLLDYDYDRDKNTYIVVEVRPDWRDPSIMRRSPFVKFKYVVSQKVWKLYWLRASGKWEGYTNLLETRDLDKIFTEIKNDPSGCFFG